MKNILVVDDRPEILEVTSIFLRDAGYAVTTLSNGAAGRAALETQSFDALVVDVVLAGISGVELADIAAAHGLAVIVCSGDPETINKLDGHSIDVFLAKPFRLTQLEATLSKLLAERERALDKSSSTAGLGV